MEGFSENEKELLNGFLINVWNNQNEVPQNLRYMERKNVKSITIKIKNIIICTKISKISPLQENITGTNMLLLAAANSVANMVGCKENGEQ